ncbi:hypothetical protein P153DRAFT_319207 [Dothidotthia symphoricarpi CBS 119687]|uniref:Aerobic respiration control sensor protein arcB n=1 Tax=Dothidotthia symphoricarpi CBS 119687 TaxID=1392245 RepID=A0A6A6AA99_9PLEO|nr:uncharacterized protein P153DRAFT_319207 [Dothidotthia symphoricarpi CBS 119687]KAF2128014.1 hypothetical protein P153DRAFT_319207 [Dothidotthia symphoricarpi CBS 119687]
MPSSQPVRLDLAQNGAASLRGVGMLDLLECDIRPTFVLDMIKADLSRDDRVLPVYWNPAMATTDSESLWDAITGKASTNGTKPEKCAVFSHFKSWILDQKATSRPFVYCNLSWMKVLVASRWNVISVISTNSSLDQENTKPERAGPYRNISQTTVQTFNWTGDVPPAKLSPHVAFARSIDWSSTSLGPMKLWSSQLRNAANLVMQDPQPAVVFYGPDLIMIYNQAEIELLGDFHPCMGVSARVALASVWFNHFEPMIEQNLAGNTVEKINTSIHMVRNGFMEETYFSLKFIPLFDSDGATVGHYESLVETTRDVISRRQSQTLLDLSEEIPRARDTESYWALATEVLSRNDKDIAYALLYSTETDGSGSGSSRTWFSDNYQQCKLQGSFGLPNSSPAEHEHLDLQQDHGFTPYFRQAIDAQKPIIVRFDPSSSAPESVRGTQWQGIGDPCRAAAICPLNPTSSKDNILGVMVIGLNPRRPHDEDYLQFILVASRLLSTSLTSILLHEEDIGRRERTIANAEAMKFQLKQQLLESQKEVERSASKFQRFAERADVGIFLIDMNGVYSYRNDAWYTILDPDTSNLGLGEAWGALIDDEYASMGQAKFEKLVETKQHQSFELRLKKTWKVSSKSFDESVPEPQPKWVICSIFPELTEDGEVLEIVGCITDISRQKWGEKLQATQALNAQESKRQLENFIDTTSHEMRNPLSAIVQCADSIITSHQAFEKSTRNQSVYRSILDTTIDAAETIVQCSKHMKTIVDDVLTMSKLDSGLFTMTPVDVALESIARDAVRMFEGEAKSAGVDLEFQLEDSCKKIDVDTISLDPTRVLQILINLITNAIKFTRLEETRHISVSLGISLEEPTHNAVGDVPYTRSSETSEAKTLQADWEKGETASVYVMFSVQDTGRGLSDAEHKLLFARFSQASPRTHIDYGGSGLGLFISRRLTEMHGGAIGFASKSGVGSTFSFYVKSRKVKTSIPDNETKTTIELSMRARQTVLRSRSRDDGNEPLLHSNPIEEDVANSDLHILIVEDNLVNQRVLAKQLRNIGMHVAVANHGGEALEYLRSTNYCVADKSANHLTLILMDWEMPIMDGLTCVRNIRELQKQGVVHGHIPVIAVTANVRSEQVEIALKAGMDDVVSKPFRIPEICACIQRTLRNTTGK